MKPTTKSTGGTSFHNTVIHCSVDTLYKVLGEPYYSGNDGTDKTNYDWDMETDDGEVFTVYDWKEYRPLDKHETIEWHIGGMSKRITDKAAREIETAINSQSL